MDLVFGQVFLILILLVLFTYFYSVIRAIAWVPMWSKDLKNVLDLADIKEGDKVYDLGCGDGKILFAAATRGAEAIGYEVSLLPFMIAKFRQLLDRKNKVSIRFKDFWLVNLADADIVFFFLHPRVYKKIKNKLEKELKPGAKVIAYVWPIEGWEVAKKIKRTKGPAIYLYKR